MDPYEKADRLMLEEERARKPDLRKLNVTRLAAQFPLSIREFYDIKKASGFFDITPAHVVPFDEVLIQLEHPGIICSEDKKVAASTTVQCAEFWDQYFGAAATWAVRMEYAAAGAVTIARHDALKARKSAI